jgi:hypothetical protein
MQNKLFELDEDWKKEWVGMPEFVQRKKGKPYAQIIFRFDNESDLQDFAKMIGQKLTKKTKSAWHPQIERGENANKIYILDENA